MSFAELFKRLSQHDRIDVVGQVQQAATHWQRHCPEPIGSETTGLPGSRRASTDSPLSNSAAGQQQLSLWAKDLCSPIVAARSAMVAPPNRICNESETPNVASTACSTSAAMSESSPRRCNRPVAGYGISIDPESLGDHHLKILLDPPPSCIGESSRRSSVLTTVDETRSLGN